MSLYPIVYINTKAGKTDELLLAFKNSVKEAIAETCEIPAENVSVYFLEHRI